LARLVGVEPRQLHADTLRNLLEEFASRDGTDYGLRETPLDERVAQLRGQLDRRELRLLVDADSGHFDLLKAEQAAALMVLDSTDASAPG
jgi:uncharacterized protein YheU (UPF0270 family)